MNLERWKVLPGEEET